MDIFSLVNSDMQVQLKDYSGGSCCFLWLLLEGHFGVGVTLEQVALREDKDEVNCRSAPNSEW